MNLPSVSVCMVVRDDLPFLTAWFEAVNQYADEVVVIDNGSKDGTYEFLTTMRTVNAPGETKAIGDPPPPRVIVERAEPSTITELGFSFLKNRAAQLATSEWIHSLDADEFLDSKQIPMLKPFLKYCKADVVSIVTRTFIKPGTFGDLDIATGDGPHLTWKDDWVGWASEHDKYEDMSHRRIYRRERNIEWRGYIHEELYQGEVSGAAVCQASPFKHLHFTNYRTWTDDRLKRARYSWMLLNAYRKPALQAYTNRWWYTVYVPQNLKDIEHWAGLYEQFKKEGKV